MVLSKSEQVDILLSYPRSGNHGVRFIPEFFSGVLKWRLFWCHRTEFFSGWGDNV